MAKLWVDSVPAWALGPRASNAKFGGGIITAGIPKVEDRLRAINRLSKGMRLTGDSALRSSGHVLHEVKTEISAYKEHNAPGAISFKRLKRGIASGEFPKWVAMTAPQFGFRGAERGGMISPIRADRTMAKDLHIEAITWSQELASNGLGAGVNIWWPAWTSRRIDDPANPPVEFANAWGMMMEHWLAVLRKTGGTMWLEWKPGDPGVDYLMTLNIAFQFCTALNTELGRLAMLINNEWAHVLISGISVAEATQRTIDAGLFARFLHANSGQKMPVSIQQQIDDGVKPEQILIGMDWDWPVGIGGQNVWDDQQRAVGILDSFLACDPIYCEHDVNPAGQGPLKVFELSIRNRQRMLANARANT